MKGDTGLPKLNVYTMLSKYYEDSDKCTILHNKICYKDLISDKELNNKLDCKWKPQPVKFVKNENDKTRYWHGRDSNPQFTRLRVVE